jgi:hypothetical protein
MNVHHQNGNNLFKSNQIKSPPPTNQTNGNHLQRPVVSTQNIIHSSNVTSGNGALYKNQQPPPVPNIKRTESVHKPGVHVGMTNPSGPPSNNGLLIRQHHQTVPQFHQSMLNLSSIGASEPMNITQPAIGMFGSRVSLQTSGSNFMKHPAYAQQANKINGHQQQHHYPPSASSRPHPTILEDPILRWIHQVNNSSSINGLTHTPQNNGGGGNRSQQQVYPYGSYIATGSGKIFSLGRFK